MDRLTLPEPGASLWRRTANALERALQQTEWPVECWTIGGGTILAQRWAHRASTDIDLTVAQGTGIEALSERLGGSLQADMNEAGAAKVVDTASRSAMAASTSRNSTRAPQAGARRQPSTGAKSTSRALRRSCVGNSSGRCARKARCGTSSTSPSLTTRTRRHSPRPRHARTRTSPRSAGSLDLGVKSGPVGATGIVSDPEVSRVHLAGTHPGMLESLRQRRRARRGEV